MYSYQPLFVEYILKKARLIKRGSIAATFLVAVAVIYLLQYFFGYENTGLFLDLVVSFSSGMALILVGFFVLEKNVLIDGTLARICIWIFGIVVFMWGISLRGGISPTELAGISFETGTIISGVTLGSFFLFGFIYSRLRGSFALFAGSILTLGVIIVILNSALFFGKSEVSVRPSLIPTLHTVALSYYLDANSIFFGSGPQSFSSSWARFKPNIVNTSPLWNEDFKHGSGMVPTLLVTHGTFFVLFFILSIVILLGSLLARISEDKKLKKGSIMETSILFLLISGSLVWIIVSNPGLQFIATAALISGYALSHTSPARDLKNNASLRFFLAILLLMTGIAIATFSGIRSHALFYYDRGLFELSQEIQDLTTASENLEMSLEHGEISEVMRLLISSYLKDGDAILKNEASSLSDVEKVRLLDLSDKAVTLAEQLTDSEPNNYRNWILMGDTQLFSWTLKRENVLLSRALEGYVNAHDLSLSGREHPLPYFLGAQVLVIQGEFTKAKTSLERALLLKPNYEEAKQLMAFIER